MKCEVSTIFFVDALAFPKFWSYIWYNILNLCLYTMSIKKGFKLNRQFILHSSLFDLIFSAFLLQKLKRQVIEFTRLKRSPPFYWSIKNRSLHLQYQKKKFWIKALKLDEFYEFLKLKDSDFVKTITLLRKYYDVIFFNN